MANGRKVSDGALAANGRARCSGRVGFDRGLGLIGIRFDKHSAPKISVSRCKLAWGFVFAQ